MPSKPAVTYLPLSRDAAAAFEAYEAGRAEKSLLDKSSRQIAKQVEEAREKILSELGEQTLGQLPDGRVISAVETKQDRAAVPATTVAWTTLVVVS